MRLRWTEIVQSEPEKPTNCSQIYSFSESFICLCEKYKYKRLDTFFFFLLAVFRITFEIEFSMKVKRVKDVEMRQIGVWREQVKRFKALLNKYHVCICDTARQKGNEIFNISSDFL